MNGRKIAMGCTVTALVVILILVTTGYLTFKHLSGIVPLQEPASLVDADTVGFAVARLTPENPWVIGLVEHMKSWSPVQRRDNDPRKALPIGFIWTARRASPTAEQQIVSFSLSPGGRFVGLVSDFALWKAGRSPGANVSRVEYLDEGISSFPGTKFKGNLFVRDNVFVWASDLDAAKHAVDRMIPAPQTNADPVAATEPPPVLRLMPEAGKHLFSGAIINENGALARCLALIPGEKLALPADLPGSISLSFFFDTTSAAEGVGKLELLIPPETPPAAVKAVASELSSRLSALVYAEVHVVATPRVETSTASIDVKVTGLDSIGKQLRHNLVDFGEAMKQMQEARGPAADPNHS